MGLAHTNAAIPLPCLPAGNAKRRRGISARRARRRSGFEPSQWSACLPEQRLALYIILDARDCVLRNGHSSLRFLWIMAGGSIDTTSPAVKEVAEGDIQNEKISPVSVSDPETGESPAPRSSVDGSEFYEDPKDARRLLLKCDIRLIPILGCLYLVSFLDRSNIANARLFGLEKSLSMPSNGFNTCLWIFYLPFVIVEIPSNLFMSLNKIKPNQWLGGAMLILGELQNPRGG